MPPPSLLFQGDQTTIPSRAFHRRHSAVCHESFAASSVQLPCIAARLQMTFHILSGLACLRHLISTYFMFPMVSYGLCNWPSVSSSADSTRMEPNFASCGAKFKASNSSFPEYTYNGSVPDIFNHAGRPKLITYEGCKDLCGSGVAYYSWSNSSQTITTWVLPIVGVLVQAPWESHALLRTLFAITRYLGSPMATLAYTLWNVKVTGKCALIVDMATQYGVTPNKESAFGRIRDSFYILSVMNQCEFSRRTQRSMHPISPEFTKHRSH